jgi:hypothetical protein
MRVRGFADWRPHQKSLDVLKNVEEVIAKYAMVLTMRQIFYRLIGRHFCPKTEKDYIVPDKSGFTRTQ